MRLVTSVGAVVAVLFLLPSGISATSVHAARPGEITVGPNIDIAKLPGLQFETTIAVNPNNPLQIVVGSIDDRRLPDPNFVHARTRAYFSSDGGETWGSTLIPLLPANASGHDVQQHDPGVAWDSHGNVYVSYASFFTGPPNLVMASKSTDGGRSWTNTVVKDIEGVPPTFFPAVDKPMIAIDTNPGSPFRDTIYVAWDKFDERRNGTIPPTLFISRSTDHGLTFSSPVDPTGPDKHSSPFDADPFVGPDGTVYVAWQDFQQGHIAVSSSTDGGSTFGPAVTIASTPTSTPATYPAGLSIPAVNGSFTAAFVYPTCGTDSSAGPHRGTLHCVWMDETARGTTDILESHSTDHGQTWSHPVRVNDDPMWIAHDHFAPWLSVDPKDGRVSVSWYDTRNDPTGVSTDVFYAQSTDGGRTFSANVKVTTAPTNAPLANARCGSFGQGDYQGIVAFGGVVRLVWTDARSSVLSRCGDIFTATIMFDD